MSYNIDFSIATSDRIEKALCERLENIRIARGLTQAELAGEAGVAVRTLGRLRKGEGVSLDTFIRVMTALGVQGNLAALLPDPGVRPIERVGLAGAERKRVRARRADAEPPAWTWGDGGDADE